MENKNIIREDSTVTVCLFCGKNKETNTVLDSSQIPDKVVIDYEPCSECREQWNRGIPLLEVSSTPIVENQPMVREDDNGNPVYLTGAYLVMSGHLIEGEVGVPVLCMTKDFNKIKNDIMKAEEKLNEFKH